NIATKRVEDAKAFYADIRAGSCYLIFSVGVNNQPITYLARCLPSHGQFQRGGVDGHLTQTLAGRSKDCIGHCRNDGGRTALAHPGRRFEILYNMDLDGRRLVHAKDLVRVEVGLFDTPVLERDLAVERGRDAEHDPALDLRPHRVGIDDRTAIDRTDHAPDANRAVLAHFDFSDLRHVGGEHELEGDATADPVRQRLSPTA